MKELLKNKLIIGMFIFIIGFTFVSSYVNEETRWQKKDLNPAKSQVSEINK